LVAGASVKRRAVVVVVVSAGAAARASVVVVGISPIAIVAVAVAVTVVAVTVTSLPVSAAVQNFLSRLECLGKGSNRLDLLLELVRVDNVQRVILVSGALGCAEVVQASLVDLACQACELVAHKHGEFCAELKKLFRVEVVPVLE
jgi:hypothetical protein